MREDRGGPDRPTADDDDGGGGGGDDDLTGAAPEPVPATDDLQPRVPRMLVWRRGYGRPDLTSDAVAGALVAILLIPQAFAYAQLANLPPAAGIAAALVAPLVYAVFGGSRFLAVGPVALVSLLVGEAIGAGDAVAMALVLAALVGAILLAIGALRLGFVFRLFTQPVLTGFVFAAALVIATSQLQYLLGISLERGPPAVVLWADTVAALGDVQVGPLVVGGFVLVTLLVLPKVLRRAWSLEPGQRGWRPLVVQSLPLVVLLVAAAAVGLWDLDEGAGVTTLGAVDLPSLVPRLAAFGTVDVVSLVGPAIGIAMVAAITTLAIATTLAARDGSEVSESRELFALGLSSLVLSFTGGYPAGGSLSRSAVVADSGGRSPLAAVVGAGTLALSALLFAPVLALVPRAGLSALIVVAALSMIEPAAVRTAWQEERTVLLVMLVPFVVVLVAGVQVGLGAALLAGGVHLAWQRWGSGPQPPAPDGEPPDDGGDESDGGDGGDRGDRGDGVQPEGPDGKSEDAQD